MIVAAWPQKKNLKIYIGVSKNNNIHKYYYYDDQRSRNVRITENHDLEMTVSENHD